MRDMRMEVLRNLFRHRPVGQFRSALCHNQGIPDKLGDMKPDQPQDHEPEWRASAWTHPYLLYSAGVLLLFVFLLGMGYLAIHNGWIPDRGISQPN